MAKKNKNKKKLNKSMIGWGIFFIILVGGLSIISIYQLISRLNKYVNAIPIFAIPLILFFIVGAGGFISGIIYELKNKKEKGEKISKIFDGIAAILAVLSFVLFALDAIL